MKFNTFKAASALAVSMMLSMPMTAQAKDAPTTWTFVKNASQGGNFEIASSQLALQKTSAQNVRNFAQMMVDDHTQLGDKMKAALATSGTGFSPATDMSADDRKTMQVLAAAAPSDFDNLYAQAQVKAHDEAVNMFTNYADNGDNDSLTRFANDALPVLKKHQAEAHALSQGFLSASR